MELPRQLVRSGVVAGALLAASAARAQVHDWTLEGDQFGESLGLAVAGGQDMDGDGCEDILVGRPARDLAGVDEGRVQVFSGRTHALLAQFDGLVQLDRAGSAGALVNDLDGDGIGEFCVGVPGANHGDGAVYMVSGKTGAILWSILGATNARLGTSVACVGDVDHDGRLDVAVGASGIDTVYVFGWNTGALHTITGVSGSSFGGAVGGGHDVDGDGTPDLVVGATEYDLGFPKLTNCGFFAVYSGKTGGLLHAYVGAADGERFGRKVLTLGDTDGDGLSEFAATSSDADDKGTDTGLVRVYDSTGNLRYTKYGSAPSDFFGLSIARIDADHDGRGDLAVGAAVSGAPGNVSLFDGNDGHFVGRIDSPRRDSDLFGWAIASSDVNGDGMPDLIVSDPLRDVAGGLLHAGTIDVFLVAGAHAEEYGKGWPGTKGVPALHSLADPVLGQQTSIFLGNSLPASTVSILLLGYTAIEVPTSAGGVLLVLPSNQIVLPLPAAGLTLSDTLPADPALALLSVYLQALIVDPGASKGLAFTGGLHLSLGYDYD